MTLKTPPKRSDTVFTENNTEKEKDHCAVGTRPPESECHPFKKTADDQAAPKIPHATCHGDRDNLLDGGAHQMKRIRITIRKNVNPIPPAMKDIAEMSGSRGKANRPASQPN